ncbi:uncharacterized protein LOC142632935 [Castanea sativa]|uniref:uncharacterized protein LOC142632935 n=1 Tax=Castanea sativa TaxID=21020 RepID=UPI003F6528ED
MYPNLDRGLGLKKEDLSKYDTPLKGFDGHMVTLEGQISLSVNMGGKEVMVTFIVVTFFSPYTAILGRPWIHDMGTVPSTLHVKVKFRTEEGITVIRDDQQAARRASLSDGERVELLLSLIQNVDIFAWSPYEVPGVNPEFIVHKLNVDPSCPPKKQKPRRSAKEHVDAVRQEVGKLKEAGAIKEMFFPKWLANTVVVKKKNGKRRVCVDFTDLNRACSKDLFLMPNFDQLVDDTYGHPRMSFLDAFQGYHQIALAVKDQEKTAFITPDANYHYTLLKKWKGFQWDEECDRAFLDLKDYLGWAPTLIAPEPREDLYMYLSVSEHAASAVLLKDSGVQLPVYYVSKTFVDTKTRYLPLEKLVLALVHSTRKLPHYFQAHTIHIYTEYPLQSLLRRSDFTGGIAKWGTRLSSFDIRYRPRNSVKGQVLADFIAEFSPKSADVVCLAEIRPWKVFVDGASNTARAGAGIVVITPEKLKLEHSFRLGFKASNNEAEYEALLAGLRVVMDLGAKEVEVYSDSLLVVNQVQGNFEAKNPG